MLLGLALLLPLLGAAILVRLIRAARMLRTEGDAASTVLALACRRLPGDRADWGRAMVTELSWIEGRSARWRFALGGLTAAISARAIGRVRNRPALAIVLAGVAACAALTVTALVSYPDLRASPRIRLFLIVLTGVLAGYIALAIPQAGDTDPVAARARRRGTFAGAALAVVWFVFATAWWNLHSTPLFVAVLLPIPVGAFAARSTGSARAGMAAVMWAGLVAGLAVFIASGIDAFATANGPYDAGQNAEYARSGLASSGAYWMGEGLATSLLLLLLVPCVTILFGGAGALAASGRKRRDPFAEDR